MDVWETGRHDSGVRQRRYADVESAYQRWHREHLGAACRAVNIDWVEHRDRPQGRRIVTLIEDTRYDAERYDEAADVAWLKQTILTRLTRHHQLWVYETLARALDVPAYVTVWRTDLQRFHVYDIGAAEWLAPMDLSEYAAWLRTR